jgi:hypothetical protein
MRLLPSSVVAAALVASAVPTGMCLAREKTSVTVSYVLGPSKPMPEGLKAVAVIDAGVQTQGAQQNERERRWSAIAADMIEAMVQNSSAQYGTRLAVAKRSQTKRVLEEQDLRLSGLVEGETATRAGKLLAVQGLITSKLTINIDTHKGSKSTLDWGGILGGALGSLGPRDGDHGRREVRVIERRPVVVAPGGRRGRDVRVVPPQRVYLYGNPAPHADGGGGFGGFALKTKEVEEISRSLTVQCSFCLIDAVTGQAIMQYSPPPYQKTDSASPDFMFGGMMERNDLDPVDDFIGELVERATQEFVGMLVPVHFEKAYELSLSGKRGEAAIRAIRADDYNTASAQLQAGIRDGKDDDGSYSFTMGVVDELGGDYVEALKMYRQAAGASDPDKKLLPTYIAAKDRLSNHLHRIMVPSATPPEGGAAPPPPGQPPATATPSSPSAPQAVPQAGPARSSNVQDEIRILKQLDAKEKKQK